MLYFLNQYGYVHFKWMDEDFALRYFNKIDGNKQPFDADIIEPLNKGYDVIHKSLLIYQNRILNIIDDALTDIETGNIK